MKSAPPSNLPVRARPPKSARESVHVLGRPHPFSAERIARIVPAGLSIAQVVAQTVDVHPALIDRLHVFVGDEEVPRALWARVKPKAGTTLFFAVSPGGRTGKNILRLVAIVAIAVLAPEIVGALAPGLEAGTIGFNLAVGAVTLVGALAINALIPPPVPKLRGEDKQESPALSLSGARNRLALGEPVPCLYGRHRFFPPFAALPYTEMVGDDMYLRLLFDCGYGPVKMSDLRIGTTPLADFKDVEVEVREGWDNDDPITLYTNQVIQEDLSIQLTVAGGPQTRTTQVNTDEAIIDFSFPGLVSFDDQGQKQSQTVAIKVEYRKAGSADPWVVFDGLSGAPQGSITEVSAPAGKAYVDYQTVDPVDGTVTVTLSTPSAPFTGSNGDTTFDSITYAVSVKSEGETLFTGRALGEPVFGFPSFAANFPQHVTVKAGQTGTVTLVAKRGKRMDIRVERLQSTYVDTTAAPGVNSGGLRPFPQPTFSYVPVATGNPTFTARSINPIRRAVRIIFPSRDQWELRFTRITADSSDSKVRNDSFLAAIKSITHAPPVTNVIPNHAMVAMRIRASEQLNGLVEEFNFIGSRVVKVWDGSAWVWEETRTPAAAVLDVLNGQANKRPVGDAKLDLAAFKAWHDACNAAAPQNDLPNGIAAEKDEPRWLFDGIVDFRATVARLIQDIAATGRAVIGRRDGKFTPIRDVPQSTPVQMFTPRNARNFTGTHLFTPRPHAIKARFIDPNRDWKEGELIVYDDGYGPVADPPNNIAQATEFDTMRLWGFTRPTQVWREVRYHIAVNKLRPATYEFECDIENLVATTGDMVLLSHPVPAFGQRAARIKAVQTDAQNNITGVTLDDAVTMTAGKTYALRIRRSTQPILLAPVNTAAGETDTLVFTTPLAPGSDVDAGDLVAFGETSTETVEAIIKAIIPGADLSARIICVDAATGVHTADQGTIPAYDPQISGDPGGTPPAVVDLTLTEDVRFVAGQPVSDVIVTWRMPANGFAPAFEIYRTRLDGQPELIDVVAGMRAVIPAVDIGQLITITVVGVSSGGRRLDLVSATSATITPNGDTDAPALINNLAATPLARAIALTWNNPTVDAQDLDHVNVYAHTADIQASATKIGEVAAPGTKFLHDVGAVGQTWYYWVRPVDKLGNEGPWNATAGVSGTTLGTDADVTWDQILNPNGTKPQDNADVTAQNVAADVQTGPTKAVAEPGADKTANNVAADVQTGPSKAVAEPGADKTANNTAADVQTGPTKAVAEPGADKTANHADDIVVRDTTAPAHQPGRIWIDLSNEDIFRSNGTSWDKITSHDATRLVNGPAEPGADVTANNTAADTAAVGGTAATTVRDDAAKAGLGLDASGFITQGINADFDVRRMIVAAHGTQLSKNPEFINGTTGYGVYNNSGGGAITVAVVSDNTAPNGSGKVLQIDYDGIGPVSPNFGGTVQWLQYAGDVGSPDKPLPGRYVQNTQILFKVWAKIPVGRTLVHNSNATGTGGTWTWLTDTAGTGDWQLYAGIRKIGIGGTLSSTGHFSIAGGANAAFTWWIARYDQVDITSAPSLFLNEAVRDSSGAPATELIDGRLPAAIIAPGNLASPVKQDQGNGTLRPLIIGRETLSVRDGVGVSFSTAYQNIPNVTFKSGGLSRSSTLNASQYQDFKADLLGTGGFTPKLRIKETAGTPTTVIENTNFAGSQPSGPAWQGDRASADSPFDDTYTFFMTIVGTDSVEPGDITLDLWTQRAGGSWVKRNTVAFVTGTSGQGNKNVTATVVDSQLVSGDKFGVSVASQTNASFVSFDKVEFQKATPAGDETATPAGVPDVIAEVTAG